MKAKLGFTLLELLVVMAIMGLSLTLVGPLVFDQVDKTKANAELKQLEVLLHATASSAYLSGQTVQMNFDGKVLQRATGKKTVTTEFNYLFFKPVQFEINSNGQIPELQLHLTANRKSVELDLGSLAQ
jgi:prepilin-type N-terminal cleavage/methylation domain-containing protein